MEPFHHSATSPLKYHTNELSFQRPAGFLDQTFHVLSQADAGTPGFNIVISRRRISGEDTLEAITRRVLEEMEARLEAFALIELREGKIDGVAGRAIEYRWQQQDTRLQQAQLLFLHQDEQGAPLLLQITGTSRAPQGMSDEERQCFAQFVASVRLRRELMHE